MVTFHFRGGGGSEKNGHYFPFSSDVELYLRSLNEDFGRTSQIVVPDRVLDFISIRFYKPLFWAIKVM